MASAASTVAGLVEHPFGCLPRVLVSPACTRGIDVLYAGHIVTFMHGYGRRGRMLYHGNFLFLMEVLLRIF